MALDFPSSPTNNQVYENYIYNSTSGAWQKLPGNTFATTAISDTPPVNPSDGNLWWSNNEETGNTLKLYNGSSFVNAAPISNNAIINGDFGVWQRGTSFTTANGDFSADRFKWFQDGSGATRTISRQSFTPADIEAVGYGDAKYFLRIATTVAGSGETYGTLRQPVEDVRTFANQEVTISFWAKAAAPETISASIDQNFGSGGSSRVQTFTDNFSVTTSWQRFSTTVTLPSLSGKTIGSSSFLGFQLRFPLNQLYTIDVWGVQLEAGSVATPFRLAGGGSKAAELALCQRYFQRYGGTGSNGEYALGSTRLSTRAQVSVFPPVPMRVTPSISLGAGIALISSNTIQTPTLLGNRSSQSVLGLYLGITGATEDVPAALVDNTTTATTDFDAEL